MKVHTVCLTGGPCAGKSTALPLVRETLEGLGFTVATVPEVATILFSNGFRLRHSAPDSQAYAEMQGEICRVQIALEDALRASLELTKAPKPLILTDRGLVDNKAYMFAPYYWRMVQREIGLSERRMLARYDRVYHLVSVADGAPEHYQQTEVRQGSVGVAYTLEHFTRNAWSGHPRRTVIDNSTDFAGKMKRLVEALHNDFKEIT